jgi:hypothetical protein
MNPKFMLDMTCKCERPAEAVRYMVKAIATGLERRFCTVKAVGARVAFRNRWHLDRWWFRRYFSGGLIVVRQAPDGIRLTGWMSRSHLRCSAVLYLAGLLASLLLAVFVFFGLVVWVIGLAAATPLLFWLEKSEIHMFFRKRFKEAVQEMEKDLNRNPPS